MADRLAHVHAHVDTECLVLRSLDRGEISLHLTVFLIFHAPERLLDATPRVEQSAHPVGLRRHAGPHLTPYREGDSLAPQPQVPPLTPGTTPRPLAPPLPPP